MRSFTACRSPALMASNKLESPPASASEPTRTMERRSIGRTLDTCQLVHFACTIAEFINVDADPLQHRQQQIRHRRVLAGAEMTSALQAYRSSAGHRQGKV